MLVNAIDAHEVILSNRTRSEFPGLHSPLESSIEISSSSKGTSPRKFGRHLASTTGEAELETGLNATATTPTTPACKKPLRGNVKWEKKNLSSLETLRSLNGCSLIALQASTTPYFSTPSASSPSESREVGPQSNRVFAFFCGCLLRIVTGEPILPTGSRFRKASVLFHLAFTGWHNCGQLRRLRAIE
jgi:hypothetical protein